MPASSINLNFVRMHECILYSTSCNKKDFLSFTLLIPISHRYTELEGREWKEFFFYRSMINGKQRLLLIDREINFFHSLPSNSVHRCEMGIIYGAFH